MAYRDMNRTLTFRESYGNNTPSDIKTEIEKNRKRWREKVTKVIQEQFLALQNENINYDDWHGDVCQKICEVYKGDDSSSPLVKKEGKTRTTENADLTFGQAQKWLNMTMKYLWLLGRLDILAEKDKKIIDRIEAKLHVPLDSYIIKYIKAKKSVVDDNALGDVTTILNSGWSKMDSEEERKEYSRLQKSIRSSLAKKNRIPLEWELEHWHKAVKAYGDADKEASFD